MSQIISVLYRGFLIYNLAIYQLLAPSSTAAPPLRPSYPSFLLTRTTSFWRPRSSFSPPFGRALRDILSSNYQLLAPSIIFHLLSLALLIHSTFLQAPLPASGTFGHGPTSHRWPGLRRCLGKAGLPSPNAAFRHLLTSSKLMSEIPLPFWLPSPYASFSHLPPPL